MRKILSSFLAFVFVVGICASAPITANAAEVTALEPETEYTLPMGAYYFNPPYDGGYKFESSDGGDPLIYIEVNEDNTDYYEDDDCGVGNNFRCFVELKTIDSVCVIIDELLSKKADLAIETTLATRTLVKIIKDAKELGYTITLI
ncbi:MAG: hypothetical protein IKC01_08985, partial [Clostridia bacterium]|nr:hypothetical protein [Clostridia bacterium]